MCIIVYVKEWLFMLQLKYLLQIRVTSSQLVEFDFGPNAKRRKVQDKRITKMIMAIVGMFVFCNTFQILYYTFFTIKGYDSTRYFMYIFGYLIVTINSSINALFYGIYSQKYRKVFMMYFCPKKIAKANPRKTILKRPLNGPPF